MGNHEVAKILAWIRDRFVRFGETPEETMRYCDSLDPVQRKVLQTLYIDALNHAINFLDGGKD